MEAAVEMHPQVSHEVFRYTGLNQEETAVLEVEMVETVQETLEDNSEKENGWFDEKLFNLGYRRMPRGADLRELHQHPSINRSSERKSLFQTPYGRGKQKNESDFYYYWANLFLIQDMAEQEIALE